MWTHSDEYELVQKIVEVFDHDEKRRGAFDKFAAKTGRTLSSVTSKFWKLVENYRGEADLLGEVFPEATKILEKIRKIKYKPDPRGAGFFG